MIKTDAKRRRDMSVEKILYRQNNHCSQCSKYSKKILNIELGVGGYDFITEGN